MKRLSCVVVVLLMLTGGLFASSTQEGTEPDTSTETEVVGNLPELQFTSNTVKVMRPQADGSTWPLLWAEWLMEYYGLEMEYMSVEQGEARTKIATMVLAGNPPDVRWLRVEDFPAHWIEGLYQPMDDYVDFNDPFWEPIRDAAQATMWKGHYSMIPYASTHNAIMFNKKIFEDNGLDTPYDLYLRGEWDWDAFRDLAIQLTQDTDGDGEIDQYGCTANGAYTWMAFIASTGKAPVTYADDGSVEIRYDDPDLVSAFQFIQDLTLTDNALFFTGKAGQPEFTNGKAAMWSHPVWKYQNPATEQMHADDTIGIAPFPRMPGLEEHYHLYAMNGFAIPVGAENPMGAVAHVATEMARFYYPELIPGMAEDLQQTRLDLGWGPDDFEMWDGAHEPATVWTDVSRGFVWDTGMFNWIRRGQRTVAQAIEEFVPQLQAAIDDMYVTE